MRSIRDTLQPLKCREGSNLLFINIKYTIGRPEHWFPVSRFVTIFVHIHQILGHINTMASKLSTWEDCGCCPVQWQSTSIYFVPSVQATCSMNTQFPLWNTPTVHCGSCTPCNVQVELTRETYLLPCFANKISIFFQVLGTRHFRQANVQKAMFTQGTCIVLAHQVWMPLDWTLRLYERRKIKVEFTRWYVLCGVVSESVMRKKSKKVNKARQEVTKL